jgi:CDP-glycerol glycerophosphotransferase (TagB/SpsB family)
VNFAPSSKYSKYSRFLRRASLRLARRAKRHLLPIEEFVATDPRRVAFIVSYGEPWSGNLRAICDHLARGNLYRFTIVHPGRAGFADLKQFYAGDQSITVSRTFLGSYLRAGTVIASTTSIRRLQRFSVWPESRRLYVLAWHGIGFKSVGLSNSARKTGMKRRRDLREYRRYSYVLASSEENGQRMLDKFGLRSSQVAITGYPRTDHITESLSRLPTDLCIADAALRTRIGDRQLVLYAPTWEPVVNGWLDVAGLLDELLSRLDPTKFAIAFRNHPRINNGSSLTGGIINLSASKFPSVEVVLRHTSVLVTDYSSIAVDGLLGPAQIVRYCPKIGHYRKQYGLAAGFESALPGPIITELRALAPAIFASLESPLQACERKRYIQRYHQNVGHASSAVSDLLAASYY